MDVILEVIRDYQTLISIFGVAFVGFLGWRRELREKRKYEIVAEIFRRKQEVDDVVYQIKNEQEFVNAHNEDNLSTIYSISRLRECLDHKVYLYYNYIFSVHEYVPSEICKSAIALEKKRRAAKDKVDILKLWDDLLDEMNVIHGVTCRNSVWFSVVERKISEKVMREFLGRKKHGNSLK